MIECTVNNLTKDYGATRIFENVNFNIRTGERIGLIGANGVGKTTLFKILMGKEDYHGGEIFYRKGVHLDYLDQIPDYSETYTTMDILYLAFKSVFELRATLTKLEKKMKSLTGTPLETAVKEYGRLQQQYEHMGGYEITERIGRILTGLKIDSGMQTRLFHLLSGGEKSRVVLGKILLETPDVLLLDEPSNHLDIQSMNWLEDYLKEYPGAVMIISHDRYFLDKVASKIIELSVEGTQIYEGNYSYYLIERQRRYEEILRQYRAQQREIKTLEQQVERFKVWGRAGGGEKMFKRASSVQKRLDKIDILEKPKQEQHKIRLRYTGSRSGREVVILREVAKSFEDKLLFKLQELMIYYQDCIAIIGANGTGKSTLLKIIMGEMPADSGEVRTGSHVNIGYLPQEVAFFSEDDNLIEAFQRVCAITITQARHELAKVLFTGDDVFKLVSQLSGGERSRLKLCILMYQEVNLLILDEPTNHLDIDSREILEESLESFTGTVIFVSHDRYFIRKMASRLVEIEDQKIVIYNGDYDYFLECKAEQMASKNSNNNKAVEASKQKQAYLERKARMSMLRSLQNKLSIVETQIQEMEDIIANLEAEMVACSQKAEDLHRLFIEKTKKETDLSALLEEWEQLSLKLEQLNKVR